MPHLPKNRSATLREMTAALRPGPRTFGRRPGPPFQNESTRPPLSSIIPGPSRAQILRLPKLFSVARRPPFLRYRPFTSEQEELVAVLGLQGAAGPSGRTSKTMAPFVLSERAHELWMNDFVAGTRCGFDYLTFPPGSRSPSSRGLLRSCNPMGDLW